MACMVPESLRLLYYLMMVGEDLPRKDIGAAKSMIHAMLDTEAMKFKADAGALRRILVYLVERANEESIDTSTVCVLSANADDGH